MLNTTVGQFLVNYVLPKDLRDYSRVLDKKGLQQLFQQVAQKHPDKYAQILYDLSQIGHRAAYWTGGYSFDLSNLRSTKSAAMMREKLKRDIIAIQNDRRLSPEEKNQRIVSLLIKTAPELDRQVFEEAKQARNPFAMQVVSGARGNSSNVRSLLAADLLYTDQNDAPVPVPVLHSYSQGLTPAEHFAGAFGSRKGIFHVKLCLASTTPVLLSDGSSIPISAVKPGYIVVGAAVAGGTRPVPVRYVYENGRRLCYRFTFANGDKTLEVDATPDHIVVARLNGGAWAKTALNELTPDHEVAVAKENLDEWEPNWRLVSKVRRGWLMTFDLDVDHRDHLFLLANGLVVENSVQEAGFFAKQLNQAAHDLVVTALDADKDGKADYYVRGLPVDTDDPDNVGALLAAPAGGYPRNTILTPEILAHLQRRNIKRILVRSPLVSEPPGGGIYARDVGVREKGQIAPVGDFVGMAAAQALSEPLSQAQLSAKHTGGVVETSGSGVSGFKLINQMVQVPEVFRGGATHAQTDGVVSEIRPAPQGGYYVLIAGQSHYVPHGLKVTVKKGQEVEAGDVLSEGIPNPAEIVRHKGIGEGRRYFVQAFRNVYKNSNLPAHRRNVELVARGLINHVRLNSEMGSYVPGDIVSYATLAANYSPRNGTQKVRVNKAIGQYLERPVLHYTIGTKIRPSVVRELQEYGIDEVEAHPEPPPFEPEMIRGLETISYDQNWLNRFLGSYLKRGLMRAVHRAEATDMNATSYVPRLAESVNFGRVGPVKGWDVQSVNMPPPPRSADDIRRSVLEGLI